MKPGRSDIRSALIIAALVILAGCSVAPYKPAPLNVDSLRQRAEVQTFEPLTVKAAVVGTEESKSLFGLPLYDHDIQPVWLEVSNDGDERVRLAMVSIDRDYFSPLEVSYKLRKGFSREARADMDKRFFESSIGRIAEPGETISGFVFTHLSPGTKSFNVDLFGATTKQNFAFFIQVPGFLPDHAEVRFDKLYSQDEVREVGLEEFRTLVNDLPRFTTDESGQGDGLPVNVVIVGDGVDVLRALLRAGWYESPAGIPGKTSSGHVGYYLYGRPADAVFRIQRSNKVDRTELRVWLAPVRVAGELVWLTQATNFVGQRSYIGKLFFGAHLDPDVDDARRYVMQNMWYSQGLQTFAFSRAGKPVSFDQPGADFKGNAFFSDGYRAVMWFSGAPYSLLDTSMLEWDEVPGR